MGGKTRIYVDPAVLESHEQHIEVFVEAVLAALAAAGGISQDCIAGLGLSAAGCVCGGRMAGLPPAFGGVSDRSAALADLGHINNLLLDRLRLKGILVCNNCPTLLVNDGDAQSLCGAPKRMDATGTSLFLSLGTGLAGGLLSSDGFCDGVLELGKLVLGIRSDSGEAELPSHDLLGVEATAQGLAGTQRALFNVLAARGGPRLKDKAAQRAELVAMQKEELTAERREVFGELGRWLAQFVLELNEYLSEPVAYVEAGGKVTDALGGQVLLSMAAQLLDAHGVESVERAEDAALGQAIAVACALIPDLRPKKRGHSE